MKQSLTLLILIAFTSCASYQTGKEVKDLSDKKMNHSKEKPKLKITSKLNRELSTEYFSFIQVDFGNSSDEWIDIGQFNFLADNKNLNVVLGKKYNEWSESIQNKIAVDRQNSEMVMGAIALGAAVAAGSNAQSGNLANTKLYLALATGSLLINDINKISNEISDIERAKLFPRNHLYTNFQVPPGLVSKKWILIEHPKNLKINEKKLNFQRNLQTLG